MGAAVGGLTGNQTAWYIAPVKNPHAVALGKLAKGKSSPKKAAAARANGQKGGRPKGKAK